MNQFSGNSSETSAVINTAKVEYLYILNDLINDVLYNRFLNMYNDSEKDIYEFQQLLKATKEWNKTQILSVVQEFLSEIEWTTEDFDDLITAIFIGHSMSLTSINLKKESNNFKLRIPSHETFIHTIIQNVAKKIFFDPYIFQDSIQKSYEKVSLINEQCVKKSIMSLLPIKELIKYSIENNENDMNSAEEPTFNLPTQQAAVNPENMLDQGDDQMNVSVNSNSDSDSDSDDNEMNTNDTNNDASANFPTENMEINDSDSDNESDHDNIKNIDLNKNSQVNSVGVKKHKESESDSD
tara:strand:+ start:115 stop:1002 length:888 start_codon:yes stop_codon:yes gene_type:complete